MKAFSVFCSVCLVLALLLSCLVLLPGNTALMASQMKTYADSARLGELSSHYDDLALLTTRYLRGQEDVFQYELTVDGAVYPVFHDYEQQHMQDVKKLFGLGKAAAVLLWLAFLAGLLFLLRHGQGGLLAKSYPLVAGAFLAVVLALSAWAAIDFDSLFILFHRLAFTNQLWLLDVNTDCLLMLMPTAFFTSYALYIALAFVLLLLVSSGAALILSRRKGRT